MGGEVGVRGGDGLGEGLHFLDKDGNEVVG